MRFKISRATAAKATLLFAVWTAYGLLSAWQTHYWYSFSKFSMSWPEAFRYEVTYAYLWGAASIGILWMADRYRIERHHVAARLALHAVAMTAVIITTKTLWELIVSSPDSPFHHFAWQKLFRSIERTTDTGVLLYGVIILVEHSLFYYRRYQTGLVNAARLQTELARAQLHALKMQLHPHFLFNTLHTITALVQEDPELAERTIARLSELLRLFLANSTIHEVPLREELRILDLYVEIECTRFADRLTVHRDVPEELYEAMVPNLVLQPLVENSIRHGVGRRSAPGWIAISAEKYGDTLVLRVTDNGEGLRAKPASPGEGGLGLAITRGRLETLYGMQQSLVLHNMPAGGAEARVTLPFHLMKTAAADMTAHRGEEEDATLQSIDC